MHLVSTEAYLVTGGHGVLQTIDSSGFRQTTLEEGSLVWFTPGTIHRAVNHGALRVAVLMSNAGLPEAGDAVMTFPQHVLDDPSAYAEVASLGDADDRDVRAARRRDLAVHGFLRLRESIQAGDGHALAAFYASAVRLVQERSTTWGELVEAGPIAQAQHSLDLVNAVTRGESEQLRDGRVCRTEPFAGEPAFGMCGRLRTYDVAP
jgi:hypothetical protein